MKTEEEPVDQEGNVPAVKKRVSSWVSGLVNEMRKKSPATIQRWVDSIAVDESENSNTDKVKEIVEEENLNCDSNELTVEEAEPSTSEPNENLKVKLNEICSKLNLKSKKLELKNLLAKTSQKLKRGPSQDPPMEHNTDESSNDTIRDELPTIHEIIPESSNLVVQRSRIGVLGRSSSENPNPIMTRHRKLNDIGRSFSVANDNELPMESSSENLIYDADEDISTITIPSLNTSPSIISNNTNLSLSNSQLVPRRSPLLQSRPLREHSVSEGHQSPQILPKNPLLRDSSFQSDSSHCSSVESLLEARKPDAEAILINLGFGPANGSDDVVSKIPKRFLKPSQVKGVDTDAFLRNQHLATQIHENTVLGYRGLLGNSHVPSDIVRAMMERFLANEVQRMSSMESIDCRSPKSFKGIANTVLAHRQFMK